MQQGCVWHLLCKMEIKIGKGNGAYKTEVTHGQRWRVRRAPFMLDATAGPIDSLQFLTGRGAGRTTPTNTSETLMKANTNESKEQHYPKGFQSLVGLGGQDLGLSKDWGGREQCKMVYSVTATGSGYL